MKRIRAALAVRRHRRAIDTVPRSSDLVSDPMPLLWLRSGLDSGADREDLIAHGWGTNAAHLLDGLRRRSALPPRS